MKTWFGLGKFGPLYEIIYMPLALSIDAKVLPNIVSFISDYSRVTNVMHALVGTNPHFWGKILEFSQICFVIWSFIIIIIIILTFIFFHN